jgi:hypothetical protein
MSEIDKLTPQHEALIPTYREKWWRILFSTEPINRQKAAKAVEAAYAAMDLRSPTILFFDSPHAAIESFRQHTTSQLILKLGSQITWTAIDRDLTLSLYWQLYSKLSSTLRKELSEKLWLQQLSNPMRQLLVIPLKELYTQRPELFVWRSVEIATTVAWLSWIAHQQSMREYLLQQPGGSFLVQMEEFVGQQMQPVGNWLGEVLQKQSVELLQVDQWVPSWQQFWNQLGITPQGGFQNLDLQTNIFELWPLLDFCTSVLNCQLDPQKWQALQSLLQECNWNLMFEKVCLVFDRPTRLHLDSENRLYTEGGPAIRFSDGSGYY